MLIIFNSALFRISQTQIKQIIKDGFYRLKHGNIDYSNVPEIIESDLTEQFVRGNGPGGSKTNKKANCVVLKHLPTGLVVKCHKARELHENRAKARTMLITKLDNLLNKENSIEGQIKAELKKKSVVKSQKQEKLNRLKEKWKEETKRNEVT